MISSLFIKGDKVLTKNSAFPYQVSAVNILSTGESEYELSDSLSVVKLNHVKEFELLFNDINHAVMLRDIEFSFHESDLYIPKNEVTEKIIEHYTFKNNVTTFHSQTDESIWYDVPFSYNEFWAKKKG